MNRVRVHRALISVHDKTGLLEFGRRLTAAGVEIVSSGGTASTLAEGGVAVVLVSDVTQAAEMLGGRVKTLHPRIHGGILAKLTDPDHRRDLEQHQIQPFELVVVNLYPFAATVADPATTWEEAIEQIDIGGPALIRAAAKNQDFVGVVTAPGQYDLVAAEVEAGGLELETRQMLAREAFFVTASYDAAIVNWLERGQGLPERLALAFERESTLRYGENPHQQAAIYRQQGTSPWWKRARLIQGKEMSFNNYLDAEAAWRLAADLVEPGVVIVKHNNPCGVALGGEPAEAFARAWECDPQAAFGGVVALNRSLDRPTAEAIAGRFIEVLIAPRVEDEGSLGSQTALRILEAPSPHADDLDLRRVEEGMMAQGRDAIDLDDWEVMTAAVPSLEQLADLRLAWTVCAHTRSNSVVIATGGMAVGIGAGDQSRIGSARRALFQAGERARGAVAASDGFFPFPDGVELLAEAGVTAIVAPGGSRRDKEVLARAEELGLVFVRAARRHFKH
ncbi:MAG: bifunctional phosphoribosylaminoimidazolecarboxamide formyltransferase/IMP cyclohydrolase [Acidimicrobiia bacterium]